MNLFVTNQSIARKHRIPVETVARIRISARRLAQRQATPAVKAAALSELQRLPTLSCPDCATHVGSDEAVQRLWALALRRAH